MEKQKISLIITLLLVLILFVLILFFGDKLGLNLNINQDKLPADVVAKKAIDYINNNFLAENPNKAEFKKVEETKNIYAITFNFAGKEYTAYATQDGELLFPEAIKMKPAEIKNFPKTAKPDIKLFVMSYCPFGNQAEEAMIPVVNLLKDKANIELRYIFYSNYASGYPEYCVDKENKYCAMHGIGELNQNIRELCVWKYQKDKFWTFVQEMNSKTDYKNTDQKWEEIAKKIGIDTNKIKECQKNETISLAQEEIALTSKKYLVQDPSKNDNEEETTISGSPTLVINGIIYSGGRSAEDYKKAICSAFEKEPEECKEILKVDVAAPQGSCQ